MEVAVAEDLRLRYAEALRTAADYAIVGEASAPSKMLDAVMAVRDEEMERLRARATKFYDAIGRAVAERDEWRERAETAERESEDRRLAYNAANAMAGVHKLRADRLKTELDHAKGALAGDSEAMAAFMADHARVVARLREQNTMWQRAAEQAEAAIDRVHALAQTLQAEAEQGEQNANIDSLRTSWKAQAHVAGLFLAALDDQEAATLPSEEETETRG